MKFAVLIAGIFLLTGYGRAAVFQEDFTTDPMGHGWSRFGETNLFYWNATNQNLEVTWDSSKSNSYFQIGTWTILGRADDFSFGVDLRLDDIEGGVDPDKPGPMEIAFGFQNYVDAEKTNFFRATGRNSPNLAEFDYFGEASGIQPTVWPALWSTNSALNYTPGDFTVMSLPLGIVMRIAVAYASSNQTMTTSITTNGIPVGEIHSIKVNTNFTDFRAGTFAIASYSDAGQSGFGAGSILAHGVMDNITFEIPRPPIEDLRLALSNGVAGVEFGSRSNWIYTLERTTNLRDWGDAAVSASGNGTNLFLQDTNAVAAGAMYRVRAERP